MRRRISGVLGAAGQAGGADDGGSAGGYVDDVFSTYVYKGNGGTQTIENGIDLAGDGGLTWFKARDDGTFHILMDTERGGTKWLNSASNAAEGDASGGWITYNSDGFTLPQGINGLNASQEMVSWTFRKAPKFFDVVTYTGDGVAGREIPHNLGCEPGMVIVKCLSSGNWVVQHSGITPLASLYLNEDYASYTSDNTNYWNNTAATSSSFTLGTAGQVNGSGVEYVAYLFAHDDSDESLIKCGGFTSDPNEYKLIDVDLGWEPQWVLIKSAGSVGDWYVFDTMRGIPPANEDDITNNAGIYLAPNNANVEGPMNRIGVSSTGFSWKPGDKGKDWMWVAIRRPNKPAVEFDPEELFSALSGQPQSGGLFPHPHVTDFSFYKYMNGAQQWGVQDRMRGEKDLSFDSSAAEGGFVNGNKWDQMEGYSNVSPGAGNYFSWGFRRAPGFMDVVAWDGDGRNGRSIPHNLGVEPDMYWIKNRDGGSYQWSVWHKDIASSAPYYEIVLNKNDPQCDSNNSNTPFYGLPTSTDLLVTSGTAANRAGWNYIAYLFASVPGISRLGSYTGNGGSQDIDCGFTHGAKCLLVKRTDANGDWVWHWPSNSGDALKYTFKLNEIDKFAAQYAVLSIPSGFSASGDICNIDGAEYIFYAIA